MIDGLPHRPVLYQEIIHALRPEQGGRYVDCTLGAGGHAWGILQASSPDGILLGLEIDPQAYELARQRLEPFGSRATLICASYVTLREQLLKLGWQTVNGVLLDLGASSMQFDTAERGFSLSRPGPLDMRFDPSSPLRAADLINKLSESELAQLIFRYGEEPQARKIARAIVENRPIVTTQELAEVIKRAKGYSESKSIRRPRSAGRTHPATRTFQALRIAVNRELESLEMVLPQALDVLCPGGRLAVISFHSLEDRIVKQFFRQESRDCLCPPRQPVCTCGHRARLKEVYRQAVKPGMEEIVENPRARSARLRVAEKLDVAVE